MMNSIPNWSWKMKCNKNYLSPFIIVAILLLCISSSCFAKQKSINSGSNQTSYVEIKPLRDLGKQKGGFVCFRLQSFNSVTESEFTEPTCSVIQDSEKLILSWDRAADETTSYRIYSGNSRKNINNLLVEASAAFNTLSNAPKTNTIQQSRKNASATKKPVRIQAENFDTFANYYPSKSGNADNKSLIRLPTSTGTASLFINKSKKIRNGTYDITVQYFDESDGNSRVDILLNDVKVGKTIKFNKNGGGNNAQRKNIQQITLRNIKINSGDTLTLLGKKNKKEAVMIDYVEFSKSR